MIRRKDFRGAHVWIGTCWFMSSRISIRFSGRKMTGSSRFVIMRVFAGGSGVMRGGRSDKSSERGVLGVFEPDRPLAIVGEVELSGGSSSMVAICVCMFVCMLL